jgi:hypothetical protein
MKRYNQYQPLNAFYLVFSWYIHFSPGIHYSHIRTPNSIATRVLSWSAVMYQILTRDLRHEHQVNVKFHANDNRTRQIQPTF